MGKEDSIFLTS